MDNPPTRAHHIGMSDRLHDHDTIGVRRGCVACAQTAADLACGRRALDGQEGKMSPMGKAVGAPQVGA